MNINVIEEVLESLVDNIYFGSSTAEINYAGIGDLYNVEVYDTDGDLMCNTTVEIDPDNNEEDIAEEIFDQLDL